MQLFAGPLKFQFLCLLLLLFCCVCVCVSKSQGVKGENKGDEKKKGENKQEGMK